MDYELEKKKERKKEIIRRSSMQSNIIQQYAFTT